MDITVSDEVSQEYHELVKNILCNREFLKLSLYTHHQWTTRLMHSINVSYLSWFIARKLGCDEKAAARAGLLHDFCPYDFKAETPTGEHQAFYHPKAAAENIRLDPIVLRHRISLGLPLFCFTLFSQFIIS